MHSLTRRLGLVLLITACTVSFAGCGLDSLSGTKYVDMDKMEKALLKQAGNDVDFDIKSITCPDKKIEQQKGEEFNCNVVIAGEGDASFKVTLTGSDDKDFTAMPIGVGSDEDDSEGLSDSEDESPDDSNDSGDDGSVDSDDSEDGSADDDTLISNYTLNSETGDGSVKVRMITVEIHAASALVTGFLEQRDLDVSEYALVACPRQNEDDWTAKLRKGTTVQCEFMLRKVSEKKFPIGLIFTDDKGSFRVALKNASQVEALLS